jgi:hypothetical protein
MSVNKFISKICNLPVPLKKKDVPSPIMLKKVFSHMHSRIVESKTGSFRFKEDETQVLLLALEKAIEHGYLQDESDRLYELERRVNDGRNALLKEGAHDPTGKGARKMVKIIGAPRKKRDWSLIYCDFVILKEATNTSEALIETAKRYNFSNVSSLIQGLRKHKVKNLPSHTSEFATKNISAHNISKK